MCGYCIATVMREQRREKIERELASAEAEFRTMLIAALRQCAAGYWGLLGQNAAPSLPRLTQEAFEQSGARALFELGDEIGELRSRLDLTEPFSLFARLKDLRGRKSANQPGEPKLAQAWLAELDAWPPRSASCQ
jgi:hypothetical protein